MRLMPRSLRWRLVLLSLAVILPALALLAWQLSHDFETSVEARVHRELENHLNQLAGKVRITPEGKLVLTGKLSNPRFQLPLSGLYWQININGKPLMRSRSLWDSQLRLSNAMLKRDGVHEYALKGPRGEELYTLVRGVWLEPPAPAANPAVSQDATGNAADAKRYIFALAIGHGEISRAVSAFNRQLYLGLTLLTILLLAAVAAQIIWGLKPLTRLRRQLESVRHGEKNRLDAPGVAELRPLTDELNALLQAQEKTISDARARAANLAHGMKTPLAVLAARARDLRQRGMEEEARDMEDQIRQLDRHIGHELARSKIHGGAAARTPFTDPACPLDGIIRALRPVNEAIEWRMEIARSIRLPMEEGDFMELAGNILENAAKWARAEVRVQIYEDVSSRMCMVVEDDGPGAPPERFSDIVRRGVRLDESVRGNGLGLAIVSDILASYGYHLRLFTSRACGLGVCVIFSADEGGEQA